MKVLKKIKENLFFVLVILAYIVVTLINPSMGLDSVKNSGYYIKEMLLIMPVIFILTALLDLWIPKDKIMKYLGKDAGLKGTFLAFVIGSISAGPIYAAFPMCVMLRKKGASTRNIVVILSSWAVIKVPMLLNEVKFLGLKFMIVRWILTVLAIILFSWLTDKMIKDKDYPEEIAKSSELTIDKKACMGCNVCVEQYPELFEMEGNKAIVKEHDENMLDMEKLKTTIEACPVKAIEYKK